MKSKTPRIKGKGFKRIKVYYSHSLWTYNTKEEAKSVEDIKKFLGGVVDVLNPRDYGKEFKESGLRKEMSFWFRLIDKADCLVFTRFRPPKEFKSYAFKYLQNAPTTDTDVAKRLKQLLSKRSLVTPGVAKEVNYALKKGKDVYELLAGKLRVWNSELLSDFQDPPDPYYESISRLLEAWNCRSYGNLIPPFLWLERL